jgi:hypothetical protein
MSDFFKLVKTLIEHILVNIAQGSHFDVHVSESREALDVFFSAASYSYDSYPNTTIGAIGFGYYCTA